MAAADTPTSTEGQAEKPAETPSALRGKQAASQAASQPSTQFSRDRLLGPDGERITGHRRHIIVGALHGDTRTELSREDAIAAVDKFLTSQVEQ